MIPFRAELRPFREWWTLRDRLGVGKPFGSDSPFATITTDGSQLDHGATWNNRVVVGVWSPAEAAVHISVLETEERSDT